MSEMTSMDSAREDVETGMKSGTMMRADGKDAAKRKGSETTMVT